MRNTSLIISFLITIFLHLSSPAFASPAEEFKIYMQTWDDNIALASKYLKEAEKDFKQGDELQGCVNQRKASIYGIAGTESLIKAFKISGSTDDLSNIYAGLKKWKELRDFC